MLNMDIFSFKNSVDPDQLASEKPADLDLHCFPSVCKYILITGILQFILIKIGERCGSSKCLA